MLHNILPYFSSKLIHLCDVHRYTMYTCIHNEISKDIVFMYTQWDLQRPKNFCWRFNQGIHKLKIYICQDSMLWISWVCSKCNLYTIQWLKSCSCWYTKHDWWCHQPWWFLGDVNKFRPPSHKKFLWNPVHFGEAIGGRQDGWKPLISEHCSKWNDLISGSHLWKVKTHFFYEGNSLGATGPGGGEKLEVLYF